ncbi:hemerythrin domain-containing protein [Aquihabitans sp. McL0605]|uniref:hemerythrin domain-containing protein n=1 Tax=Aquihabitans sp. McL0605 TaxID=3415671 RepID=UPI003CEC03C3
MSPTPPSSADLLAFTDVASAVAGGTRPHAPLYAADLYRDIHKGIRAELFGLTMAAGSLAPDDDTGRAALAAHLAAVETLLTQHAGHEEDHVDPVLRDVAPDLAEEVDAEHAQLHHAFHAAAAFAAEIVHEEASERRGELQLLYLQLSGFTSAYLQHQLVEERIIMPLILESIGPDATMALMMTIIGSIPPEQMADGLVFMLPAMNAPDRAEMLGGMAASAPPEAFQGVLGLARTVLSPDQYERTEALLPR